MRKTHYTVTVTSAPMEAYGGARMESSKSFVHKRSNLTERGIERCLRDARWCDAHGVSFPIGKGSRVIRVERMAFGN